MMIAVRRLTATCTIAAFAAGCGGSGVPSAPSTAAVPASARFMQVPATTSSGSPIKHVVLVVQENRSFNDFFATYPGADGTTTGQAEANPNCSPAIAAGPIALTKMPLALAKDMNHSWKTGYSVAYDGGKMDGFDLIPFGNGTPECTYPYQYTDPNDIQPYWDLAKQYTLAEHMFTTEGSDSFTAHQDLIRGGTIVEPGHAMVDDPTCANCFWGCNASPGTITHLITAKNVFIKDGLFPCTTKFKNPYHTLRDLLDAKKISWKYYIPPSSQINGKLFSAFDVIWAVRNGTEWKNNISSPETNILSDVKSGSLPQMSWLIPEGTNSDHPGTLSSGKPVDTGPEWIATVVNAIGNSAYWNSTAIIIVWDDWGGLYDNEGGKLKKYAGPGERVPALIISPYARAGNISKTTYQFGSILKYVEGNWKLGSLHTTDKTSASIIDCFNYKQTPIPFQSIPSSLGANYFLHEHHSYEPPDDDW